MDEIMNYEEEEVMEPEETTEVESEETGMSTGVAMLIGAGLTVAAAVAVKLGKKLVAKFRAKKALEDTTDDRDFVIPSDEEIEDVTK
ncbi:MAG: hypothetical protein MR912_08665 [Prevotella sp.]|nr:hypothetical protein [Prevotella sp.]